MIRIFYKNILLLLLISFVYNCGVSQNYIIKYNDVEPSKKQKVIIEEIKKANEVMLFFDGGFKEDSVSIVVSGEEKYNGVVSTDNRIGTAKSYTFLETDKKIEVLINEYVINLIIKNQYPFISIDLEDGIPIIEYRKVFKTYE